MSRTLLAKGISGQESHPTTDRRGCLFSIVRDRPRPISSVNIRTEAKMFKVGDRVAVIHIKRRREVVRIDTVEIVTPKDVVTDHAQFNAETGFQVGCSAPEFQIAPLTPEHEAELNRAAKNRTRSHSPKA
jgi:hypothetical protein